MHLKAGGSKGWELEGRRRRWGKGGGGGGLAFLPDRCVLPARSAAGFGRTAALPLVPSMRLCKAAAAAKRNRLGGWWRQRWERRRVVVFFFEKRDGASSSSSGRRGGLAWVKQRTGMKNEAGRLPQKESLATMSRVCTMCRYGCVSCELWWGLNERQEAKQRTSDGVGHSSVRGIHFFFWFVSVSARPTPLQELECCWSLLDSLLPLAERVFVLFLLLTTNIQGH